MGVRGGRSRRSSERRKPSSPASTLERHRRRKRVNDQVKREERMEKLRREGYWQDVRGKRNWPVMILEIIRLVAAAAAGYFGGGGVVS